MENGGHSKILRVF